MMKYILLALSIFLSLPAVVSAQEAADLTYIESAIAQAATIIGFLLPIIVTLAVLFFFWGLALFILNAGDEEARGRGKSIMIWGVIALFVIVAVWGLVELLASILGVSTGDSAPVPGVGELDQEGWGGSGLSAPSGQGQGPAGTPGSILPPPSAPAAP